ncbi:MAG TPA: hypothetical protein VM716_03935 [Gemmatimonadales bacterium]|nr:hypothetical protein [Gemmatimonadales bacterium]
MSRRELPEAIRAIQRELASQNFASLAEAQAFLDRRMSRYNATPQQELGGLSPRHMFALLDGDWDRSGPLRLNPDLRPSEVERSVLVVNARRLLEALADARGVRVTGRGNLPRGFVAELVRRLSWASEPWEGPVQREQEVWPLHVTRVVLELAGLVARRGGRARVTRRGAALASADRAGELYVTLFRAYFRTFNLAYLDRLPAESDEQHLLPFALWSLSRLESSWRGAAKLAERLMPVDYVRRARAREDDLIEPLYPVIRRVIEPLADFGLLERRLPPGDGHAVPRVAEFRPADLVARFLSFDFGDLGAPPPPEPPHRSLRLAR